MLLTFLVDLFKYRCREHYPVIWTSEALIHSDYCIITDLKAWSLFSTASVCLLNLLCNALGPHFQEFEVLKHETLQVLLERVIIHLKCLFYGFH